MDLQETLDYVKQFYKQPLNYAYDDSCISKIEFSFCDGEIFPLAKVTYNKVRLDILNESQKYVRLAPSEDNLPINQVKDKLNLPIAISKSEIEHLQRLSVFKNLNRLNHGFDEYLQSLIDLTGNSKEQILKKAGLPC